MDYKRRVLSALFFCISLFFSTGVCVSYAQGVRIDHPSNRLVIKPGSYDSGEIRVDNTSSETLAMRVYLEDWVYTNQDGSKEFYPKGTTPLSASNWITFYPADFKLPPKGSQLVRYTVNVPEGVKGGHYSIMFFEMSGGEVEQLDEKGNLVRAQLFNRLGALFHVEPDGTIERKIEITKLDVSESLNDLHVVLHFINNGNIVFDVTGNFNVIDAAGNVHVRGVFDEVYGMPGDKAILQAIQSSKHLEPGDYDILINLDVKNSDPVIKEARFTVAGDGSVSNSVIKD